MTKKIEFPCVFHFWKHPYKDEISIGVRFPDLINAGLSAATVGHGMDDAREAAKDVLEIMLEEIQERGLTLPSASPLSKVEINGDFEVQPLRVIVENVSITI